MKTLLAAAALSATVAAPASASVMFDFTGYSDGAQEELVQSVGGLTVTVTAGAYFFDNEGPLGGFFPDVDGLIPGVIDIPDLVVSTQDSTVGCFNPFTGFVCPVDPGIGVELAGLPGVIPDLNGATDLLTFTFNKVVNFQNVIFGNVDGDDDVDVFIDGVLQPPSDRPIDGNNSPFALSGTGTSISFGADQLSFFNGTDDFNVQKLTVAAVPLPAAGLVLLTALGGVGAAYRRRQKKKAA